LTCEGTIQFVNTTNYTKDNKIIIGEFCHGVTAVKDKIYIGGINKVIILNIDGTLVREITIRPSRGRVTTALSVHGTTVIHQGPLVNDISSS
jgi:hypothetical protein